MTPEPIVAGSTIGILGGGQLARMLALAARPMGYRIVVLDPDPECPAAPVCDEVIAAPYDSAAGLERLADVAHVVTLEFENVPSAALLALEQRVLVRPARRVLEIARDRVLEKQFLNGIGVPTARWAAIEAETDMQSAIATVGFPAIIKTATLGYDGKGQRTVSSEHEVRAAWKDMGNARCVLEAVVPFACEISVIVARTPAGEQRCFAPFENRHSDGILDITSWPARIDVNVTALAEAMALQISSDLDAVGLLTVEMFVIAETPQDAAHVVVNEIAPRPHNSGHLTIEAAPTSQFAQAIRAVCGLALGDVTPHSPAAMANLLGDLWTDADHNARTPHWARAFDSGAQLHLYGKREPRAGRKMGHLTVLATSTDVAIATVIAARQALTLY